MPPADMNAPAPEDPTQAPQPVTPPEQPKKQGFWAKLFGGKKDTAPAVPENRESLAPPPQLDVEADRSVQPPTPAESADSPVGEPAAPAVNPEQSAPFGTEPAQDPSVPSAGVYPPEAPAQPPVGAPGAEAPEEPRDESQTPPANPTQSL